MSGVSQAKVSGSAAERVRIFQGWSGAGLWPFFGFGSRIEARSDLLRSARRVFRGVPATAQATLEG